MSKEMIQYIILFVRVIKEGINFLAEDEKDNGVPHYVSISILT